MRRNAHSMNTVGRGTRCILSGLDIIIPLSNEDIYNLSEDKIN